MRSLGQHDWSEIYNSHRRVTVSACPSRNSDDLFGIGEIRVMASLVAFPIWRAPMKSLHKPVAAFAFLVLAAIIASCTTGGPGARSLNEPANSACAYGFAPSDGSCDF